MYLFGDHGRAVSGGDPLLRGYIQVRRTWIKVADRSNDERSSKEIDKEISEKISKKLVKESMGEEGSRKGSGNAPAEKGGSYGC